MKNPLSSIHVGAVTDQRSRKFLAALLVSSAALAMSASTVRANTLDQSEAGGSPAPGQASAQDIIVTGSRIVRDGFKSPTPLSVIGSDQLTASANSNIAQTITTLPAFTGSGSPSTNTTTGSNGAAGINSLNLRSLGANRSLVLVDGHRVTPALTTGVVDVNAIPQALVSRVDVVTGGVSSVYGSDAVAGVVNFILDKTFTGLKGELSGGATRYGDGQNYKVSLAAGAKFAGGRGHFMIAGEQVYNAGIGAGTRAWNYVGRQLVANPAWTATNGQPRQLVLDGVGYMSAAPGGIVYQTLNASNTAIAANPLRGTAFGAGGQVYQLNMGAIQSDPFMQGGGWQTNDLRPTNAVAPSESRQTAFARASFEVSDALNLYGQFSYVKAKTQNDITTAYMIGTSGPMIKLDNAFLPASVRAAMVSAGASSLRLGTLNQDLGVTYQITDREAVSYNFGGNGKFDVFGRTWRWDAYFQQGSSHNIATFPNNISRSNYTLATDAVISPTTGAIVCRSTLTNPTNGCAPYNPLGVGVNDPNGAGSRYIHSASLSDLTIRQTVLAASLTGELFSTWAGPVSAALSAEYRKDSAHGTVDADSLAANHVYANYAPIDGSTNVKEFALEMAVPLARQAKWADALDLNGAVRYTSYSLAGPVTTWKIGGTYSPIPDITFRVTKSRDIRAPNLQELFLPQNSARQSIFDPFTNTTPAFNQVTTGNLNLKPEKADTLDLGVVFRPSFLPGFSASVDYWSIDLKGAISVISAANVLLTCYDHSHPELCGLISRDSSGVVTQVIQQNVNIAGQKTRGLDFEASYRMELDKLGLAGRIDLHGNATRYLESTVNNGITSVLDFVGENGGTNPPKWTYNTTLGYTLNGFRAALTARGFSSGTMFGNYIECTSSCPATTSAHPTVNSNYMPGRLYLDLALSYDFTLGANRKMTAFFNVRNLTNKAPGLSVQGNAFGNGANAAALYEVEGTVFRGGVRFKI